MEKGGVFGHLIKFTLELSLYLAYLDHFCHHLVYFHKTNSFSYL
jgi:hypothetical protein